MRTTLLSRNAFREGVFKRDRDRCVVPGCGAIATDAHHLLERRLWDDGGYYLDNGVAVCNEHHLDAESTAISCDDLRSWAGIRQPLLPAHLSADERYDKWGNIIQPNGVRLPGELFFEASTQKVLAPYLNEFVLRFKYPRTPHLPWSPGAAPDDTRLSDLSGFENQHVVITEKLDGECTTLYHDYMHARSTTFQTHPSRTRMQQLHARIKNEIPVGWRICGENVYAAHSIRYRNLESYFYVFSIWDQRNVCLSWPDTLEYAGLLGLTVVPEIFYGSWDEPFVRGLLTDLETSKPGACEGYVVRGAGEFAYRHFRHVVAKCVRKNHVTTDEHWLDKPVIPNLLRKPPDVGSAD